MEDRIKIVKGNSCCVVCLHKSHLADSCKFKDSDKNVCGLGGCIKHHHTLLHGSQDPFVKNMNTVVSFGEEAGVEYEETVVDEELVDWSEELYERLNNNLIEQGKKKKAIAT